jgi:hypothetical protein
MSETSRLFGLLLCKLGLHRWVWAQTIVHRAVQRCEKCGKRRVIA